MHWINHDGGENPIKELKAGDFELRYRCQNIEEISLFSSDELQWPHEFADHDIIAYRVINDLEICERGNGQPDTGQNSDSASIVYEPGTIREVV